jgi:hypothetical protein
VQSASLPQVLLVLRMCLQAERMDFAAVASTLAQYPRLVQGLHRHRVLRV